MAFWAIQGLSLAVSLSLETQSKCHSNHGHLLAMQSQVSVAPCLYGLYSQGSNRVPHDAQ